MTIKESTAYMTQAEYDALPQKQPHDEQGYTIHGSMWITPSIFTGAPSLAYYRDPEGHLNRWNYLGTGMTVIYNIAIED